MVKSLETLGLNRRRSPELIDFNGDVESVITKLEIVIDENKSRLGVELDELIVLPVCFIDDEAWGDSVTKKNTSFQCRSLTKQVVVGSVSARDLYFKIIGAFFELEVRYQCDVKRFAMLKFFVRDPAPLEESGVPGFLKDKVLDYPIDSKPLR